MYADTKFPNRIPATTADRRAGKLATALLLCLCATVSAQDLPAPRIHDINNTDQQCVKLARTVLSTDTTDASPHIPGLITCLKDEYFYFDKGAAKQALAHIGEPAVAALIPQLQHTDRRIAEGAAHILGLIGRNARAAVPALKAVARTRSKPGDLRQGAAAMALGKIGEIDFLMQALQDPDLGISQHLAMQGLGAAGNNAAPAVPVLMAILNTPDGPFQMDAARALGEIGAAANPAVPRLRELTDSPLNFVRHAAGEALLKIGTTEALQAAKPYQQRKYLFDTFFQTMAVFIRLPWLAAILGLMFATTAFASVRRKKVKTIFVVPLHINATLWLLYSVWEFYASLSGANIRVDLLFIYPLLAITTLLSLVIWLLGMIRPTTNPTR